MTFRIGQKVVRNNRKFGPPNNWGNIAKINVGDIITIREIEMRGMKYGHPAPTLRFEEITNPSKMTCEGIWELGYDLRQYSPIVEKKTNTGMAILQEILDRETIKDKEPVKLSATPEQDRNMRNQWELYT